MLILLQVTNVSAIINNISFCHIDVEGSFIMAVRKANETYTVVSYFCGCGGLDLGFRGDYVYHGEKYEKLPFKILDAYDFNDKCVTTYNNFFGNCAHVADLAQKDPATVPAADVLIGGFPCQDFSSCGPLRGLDSERGQLYKALTRYMSLHRPKIVVGENVINLERMQNGEVIKIIVNDLSNIGYKVVIWKMYAPDYGVPQRRTRLFFICVRNDLSGFPRQPEPLYAGKHRSIEWAIGDLVNVDDESIPNQSQYFEASKAKNGNGQGDESCKKDFPAYTIRANPKSRVQFHYSLNRRLTVRECARIQTFPDDFKFEFAKTVSISQIGNAVPPILASCVAESIANYLNDLGRVEK